MSPRQTAPTYTSGWCGTADHSRCRGSYATASCSCPCHAVLLDALNTARLAVSDASVAVSQARADLAYAEMHYGDAMAALHRAIDDVVYGPPRAAETPGGPNA